MPGVEVAVEGARPRRRRLRRARGVRQARPARGPVLRGDDLRDAVAAARRGRRTRVALHRPGARGPSGSSKARCTPSCGSTAHACGSSRSRRAPSAGCARGRSASAPASRSRSSSCVTHWACASSTPSASSTRTGRDDAADPRAPVCCEAVRGQDAALAVPGHHRAGDHRAARPSGAAAPRRRPLPRLPLRQGGHAGRGRDALRAAHALLSVQIVPAAS